MAALSAKATRTFKGDQDVINALLADSDTYYAGGIMVESSGEAAIISSAAANQAILGILTGMYSDGDRVDAKVIGASNTIKAELKRGKVWLSHTGAAQTDVGGLFVPSNDNDMVDCPTTVSTRFIAYMALEYDSSKGLLFDLRNPLVVDNPAA